MDTWKFLAEGHLNAVFTNNSGKILRCRKSHQGQYGVYFKDGSGQNANETADGVADGTANQNFDQANPGLDKKQDKNTSKYQHHSILQTHFYVQNVISQIVPAEFLKFLPSVKLVQLNSNQFYELNSCLENSKNLRSKDGVLKMDEQFCLEMDDACFSPKMKILGDHTSLTDRSSDSISIEIKPKCGFTLSENLPSRFLLQQKLKLQKKSRNVLRIF